MIKIIAVDLGGVLFTEGKSVLVKKLADNYRYDPVLVLNVLKSPRSYDLRKGLISDDEFWSWAKTQLPENYDVQLIQKEWYDSYMLDEDVYKLLEKLNGKYTLLVFSGNIKSRIEYLDKKYDFRKLFDIEVYSYEYHLCKPEKEFVEAMINVSKVAPNEILYIDDKTEDAEVARPFGINLIIYKNGEITKLEKELNQYRILI